MAGRCMQHFKTSQYVVIVPPSLGCGVASVYGRMQVGTDTWFKLGSHLVFNAKFSYPVRIVSTIFPCIV